MGIFVQNCKKTNMQIFAFCVITLEQIRIQIHQARQTDHLNLSFVKDEHIVGQKMARNAKTLKYVIVIYCASEYMTVINFEAL